MKKTKLFLLLLFGVIANVSLYAQTTINGLTIIANYPDYKLNAPVDSVSMMMNQASGFTAWGNNGSVKEYFSIMSNGKVNLNLQVIKVELNKNFSYYHGDNLPYNGGHELVKDVVTQLNITYPAGFSNLTQHPIQNRLWSFNIITAGYKGMGVAYGFEELGLSVLSNGQPMPIKDVALSGFYLNEKPEINVICHELGHSTFGWTDHYRIGSSAGNQGHYCLMSSGGRRGSPMPMSPALRLQKQWVSDVVEIGSTTQTYSVVANDYNKTYKYTNPNNPKEYFLVEAYKHGRYYLDVCGDGYPVDEGLAIWYVDENGGIDQPSFETQPLVKLIQADGLDELNDFLTTHNDKRGDMTDLFDNTVPSVSDLHPFLRWRDGSNTGLNISNISAVGNTMTFKVNKSQASVSIKPAANGRTLPSGLINLTTGQNLSVNFLPDPGYEVDYFKVDGVTYPAATYYNFMNVTSARTIEPVYKKITTLFPSPWQSVNIGNPAAAGEADYASGQFRLLSHGSDIWGGSDQFQFVYQIINGDCEIVARVMNFNKPNEWAKSAVMIRENANESSKHIMLVRTAYNGIAAQWRNSTAGGSDNFNNNQLGIDSWIKLKRTGNLFLGYHSRDGVNWTLFHTQSIVMNQQVLIGMAVSGANINAPNKTIFDNVNVSGTTNIVPAVSIVSPTYNSTFDLYSNITINANAIDNDGFISKVEFYNGTNLIGTDNTSPYSHTITNAAAGVYTISARAYDNLNASVASNVVLINVSGGNACTAAAWSSSTAYFGGSIVQYNGVKYKANWWTQNERPDLTNGGPGTGKPWLSLGACNSKMGVYDNTNVNSFITIAPNPTVENSMLTLNLPEEDNVVINVYDRYGMVVAEIYSGQVNAGERTFDLKANALTPGLYMLGVRGDKGYMNLSFIKQ